MSSRIKTLPHLRILSPMAVRLCRIQVLLLAWVIPVLLSGCMKGLQKTTPLPGGVAFGYAEMEASEHLERSPGSFPSPGEELWVISRSAFDAQAEAANDPHSNDLPGGGALMTRRENQDVPVPLKHTAVQASISGYIATVHVTQQFHNPYDGKIEAVYVFPLPENAAIDEFVMTIGDRRIRGIIREREEAEEIYRAARNQGYVASLLTQERPNIFTQSVANIEPGKAIDVQIRYFHTLAYSDGWFEFVFPMVVGPRFNPPANSDGVGAVGRGSQGLSGQKTEVSYLRPNERSGHDIALGLNLQAGLTIEEFRCLTHAVSIKRPNPESAVVSLDPADAIPNKDFVLRYRLAGDGIKSALLTHRDERGGFFTLMLLPPAHLTQLRRAPMEMVFVLDCSGSMSGVPLRQAKAAVDHSLRHLQTGDSFQLINFSEKASQLGPRPLEVNQRNIGQGLRYLQSLNAEGGTMMLNGIKAALEFPHDPERFRLVTFLTDGYIGNESEILKAMADRLGDARIFSFGVGSAPNRYLMDSMARLGRGAVAYLGPQEDAAKLMDAFLDRISHPALTDLEIDWGGMDVSDVYPRRLPDVFVGRPVIVTGKFQGKGSQSIRIRGKAGSNRMEHDLKVNLDGTTATHAGLPSVWARLKIADLYDKAFDSPNPLLPGQIKRLALDFNLMSAYTAFVAVDASQQTAGRQGTTVPVPVPVPEGVQYETTVEE